MFRSVLDDVHEKVRSGTALSDAFDAHGDLFPRVYTASLLAGERSGNLDAVLRRYVEYTKIIATVKRKTISALVYPAILDLARARARVDHRAEGRAGVLGLLRDRSAPSCRSSRAIIVGVSDVRPRAVPADRRRARRRGGRGVRRLGAAAGAAGALRSPDARRADARRTIARKFATSQMARTLATLLGGGLPLVNALDIAARVGRQPVHGRRSSTSSARACAKGESFAGGARGAARRFRKSR